MGPQMGYGAHGAPNEPFAYGTAREAYGTRTFEQGGPNDFRAAGAPFPPATHPKTLKADTVGGQNAWLLFLIMFPMHNFCGKYIAFAYGGHAYGNNDKLTDSLRKAYGKSIINAYGREAYGKLTGTPESLRKAYGNSKP